MDLKLDWFLPTSGDGRGISGRAHPAPGQDADVERPPDIGYMGQIARAAEQLGFDAVLTPTGIWCEDAWLVTAALTRDTERLRFIVAFRPGLTSPTLAAHMAGTYQRLSAGRLLLNVVTGGQSDEQRRFGDFLPHDERYERCEEFLAVVRGAWDEKPYDFHGKYYRVEGGAVFSPPDPLPDVYFGGSSPAAVRVAARQADVYLTWGEPPALVSEKLARVRQAAAEEGRSLRFGMRVHVIARDRSADAWAEAARLLSTVDPDEMAAMQQVMTVSESVGQARQLTLHAKYRSTGDPRDLEIHPGLWAGIGLLRGGAGTAMVGSHDEVADLIEEYAALGIEEFILSGYPHLEEAYWFGENVLPELRRRTSTSGRRTAGQRLRSPATVGNLPCSRYRRSNGWTTWRWPTGTGSSPTTASTSPTTGCGSWKPIRPSTPGTCSQSTPMGCEAGCRCTGHAPSPYSGTTRSISRTCSESKRATSSRARCAGTSPRLS
jgi:alkanesulfonate monooxygenase